MQFMNATTTQVFPRRALGPSSNFGGLIHSAELLRIRTNTVTAKRPTCTNAQAPLGGEGRDAYKQKRAENSAPAIGVGRPTTRPLVAPWGRKNTPYHSSGFFLPH